MEKITLTKNESFKIINPIYFKLERILESISHGNYGKVYFDLIKAEEKEHRNFTYFYGVTYGLTVSESVKLFYVKRIAEALQGEKIPLVKDFLFCQKSCFYAFSLVENYRKELKTCFSRLDFEKLDFVDYADLMK